MDISIIICTRNRAAALEDTLSSLKSIDCPSDMDVELIIVDNASNDNTPDIISEFRHPEISIKRLHEEKKGKSNALNLAIKKSRGSIILFSDDDIRFPENWIAGMSRPILEKRGDAVAGGVNLASYIERQWMESFHRSLLASTEHISSSYPEHPIGANMAIGKYVFDKIPKFDNKLGGGQLGNAEDTLIGWQIWKAGFKIVSAFDIAVEHHPDLSRLEYSSFCEVAKNRGKSEGYISYHWSHTRWPLWKLIGGIILLNCRLLPYYIRAKLLRIGRVGITKKEFDLRRQLSRILQHIREYGNSSNYQKFGLFKINH